MKKVGIIRCMQTEDMCVGDGCFRAALSGTGAFAYLGPVEIVGFISCGGCPGKKAVSRARMMVARGAEIIVQASCITLGTPIGFPCPFAKKMREAISANIASNVTILEYSHPPKK